MKKLIKLDFNNTTRERKTEDSYSELYSHDKNNGLFEFEILNDTLTTEQVIALFKFTESNKIWKTTGTVEGNKVHVTFDTSLITQNETVICYLYFDEEQRTSDTYRFKFKVKVSEIDKISRYEVKERFINNTVIVDRLDVVTKDELKEALKNVGGIATEGLLTEVKAEELYAKKSEAVDNTNFELVKNRVLALELKTDKDTVYDDSELKGRISVLEAKEDNNTIYDDTNVRERLTALESKPNVDVNNLVTKDELASKNYLTEHQDTSNFALKSEIPQQYNDTEVKERLTTLENKAPVDLSNYATKEELRNVSGSQPNVDNLVTKDELENKHYISDVSNLATKEELNEVRNSQPTVDTSHLVTREELEEKHYLTEIHLNSSELAQRVTLLEEQPDKDTVYDDKPIRDRLDVLEAKHDNDTIYDDTEVKRRLTELEGKPVLDTSFFITEEKLNSKGYLTTHQDISNLATKEELANVVTKEELNNKHYVTEEELNNKAYLTQQNLDNYALKSEIPQPYNDSTLNERVTALESKAIEGGAYDDSDLRNRVVALEGKEDKDTKYDDTDLRNRVTNLENKPPLDTSEFVTNQALESKGYLTTHQSLDHVVTKDELASKNYISDVSNLVTKDELASKNYLTEHQPLTEVNNRLDVLEAKQDKDTVYNDTELRNRVAELESRPVVTPYNDTPLKERVEVLETKVDKDTVYNDSELRERVTNLENKPNVDLTNYVTNEQLENKHYLTQHQPLDNLVTKEELNSKGYVTEEVLNGKNYLTEDVLSTKNYLTQHQDLSSLVTKQELENKHYLTEHQNISHLVTKEELETKGYLTQHQSLEEYAKKSELYNDTEVKQRLATLENKPNIDTSNFVTNEQLEGKHYLTEHQPLTHLATTSDLEVLRNISVNKAELSKKVDTTEYNSFKDSVVTKSELAEKGYISDLSNYVTKQELHEATEIDYSNIVTTDELEGKHYLTANDISNLATKQELQDKVNKSDFDTLKDDVVKHNELAERHYLTETTASDIFAKKSELPQPYNDSALVSRVTALESRPNSENGHSLNTNVRIEGTFKNGVTSQLNLFADVFFDGEVVTSGYTLDYYYRGFGNNNWQVLNNQTADSTGRFGTWGAQRRNGEYFEVRIVVSYRGLKATSFARLDNVVDGVINQQNNRPLRYWCGTQAQYDAIQYKDVNTIYDIFKQV